LHDIANGVIKSDFEHLEAAKRLLEIDDENERRGSIGQVSVRDELRGSRGSLFRTAAPGSVAARRYAMFTCAISMLTRLCRRSSMTTSGGLASAAGLVWRTERQQEVARAVQTLLDAMRQSDDDVWLDDLDAAHMSPAVWRAQLLAAVDHLDRSARDHLAPRHAALPAQLTSSVTQFFHE
jgi:hypothetical protein